MPDFARQGSDPGTEDHFPASSPALDRGDLRALAEFRYVIRRFLDASERMAQEKGLTPQQHQLLLAIAGRPEGVAPTVGYLAERLLVKHHSAVGLVDRLAEAGLITREGDPTDRRQVLVRLTAPGARLLDELAVSHREELRTLAPQLIDTLDAILGPGRRGASGEARTPPTSLGGELS